MGQGGAASPRATTPHGSAGTRSSSPTPSWVCSPACSSAGLSIKLAEFFPVIASVANLVFFSLSAMSLLFLSLGLSFPVTHHITIIAGLGALTFLPIVGGNAIVATIIGAVCGTLSAWCAELFARLWHDHGNTHIDPPAAAIWPMTTVVLTLGALLGTAA